MCLFFNNILTWSFFFYAIPILFYSIEDKKVKRFSTAMIKTQPIFVIVMTCGSFVLGGIRDLTNLQAALNNCFSYFVASTGVALTTTLFFSIIKEKYNDKIKNDNVRIDVIRKIKNDFEKEKSIIKEHEYIRGGIYPNQIFNFIYSWINY